MKRCLATLLALAALACVVGPAEGAVKFLLARQIPAGPYSYYLDPVNGSDANDGTTLEQAWATVAKVTSGSTSADTIHITNMNSTITTVDWPDRTYYSTDVNQFGKIKWTFSEEKRVGQFANHDMWVLAPISIKAISPASNDVDGRIRNGSVLNPSATAGGEGNTHGYDNHSSYPYAHSLNVGFDVNDVNFLTIATASSLVSTITNAVEHSRPQVTTAAILTILESAPSAGSFRPAYTNVSKVIQFNKSQLDYTNLALLSPVASSPTLATVTAMFEGPWLDHMNGPAADWVCHPSDWMPNYGRDLSTSIGIGAMMLHLNYTNTQKETLMIRFVQLGIDLYGISQDGGSWIWHADGGIGSGRKWPILFAGIVLNNVAMKGITGIAFQEDGQTFYVAAAPADVCSVPYALSVDHPIYGSQVNVTHDSATVVGIETSWVTGSYRDYFALYSGPGSTSGVGGGYQIASIDDNTHLTLASAYPDTTENNVGAIIGRYIWYGHGMYEPDPVVGDFNEYVVGDIGLPEYGIHHNWAPINDGKNWDTDYRRDCTANAWGGFVLAAIIMESGASAKTLWAHDPLFDYMDRYMAEEQSIQDTGYDFMGKAQAGISWYRQNSLSPYTSFVEDMWDTYRANYPPVWSE